MIDDQKYRPVSVGLQFVFILISMVIIAYCMYSATTHFTSTDTVPSVQKFTPSTLETFGTHSAIVSCGLYIKNFIIFDPIKNHFTFNGVIWFEFNPEAIPLDVLNKFTFERAEILEKSEPETRIINGRFLVQYTIRVNFNNQLNYRYFPFDDHRIYLQLTNSLVFPNDVIFDSMPLNFIIKTSVSSLGWDIVNKDVEVGFYEVGIKQGESQINVSHPSVLFSLDAMRNGVRYALTILLPLLAIFFISLFIFSIDTVQFPFLAITLSAGSVTAILAYRFVIENFSPTVGYFMVSDYIYFLFVFVTSLVFMLSNILPRLYHWHKIILLLFLHCITTGIIAYILYFWLGSL